MNSLLENIDLMTYKINFNYQKRVVYHSFFGIIVSLSIYACILVLTQYFASDFINKINPRIIYQETEFTENFTLPLSFILNDYNCILKFKTQENLYNISQREKKNFCQT